MVTPVLTHPPKAPKGNRPTFFWRQRQKSIQLWLTVLSMGMIGMLFHSSGETRTDSTKLMASNAKSKSIIHPRPDGSKDYNLSTNQTTSSSSFHAFSFYLMGDTPYRDWQETRLELQMMEMKQYVQQHPARNLSFTVHVGDLQK
ncbi:MAG: hypothetical protein SGARI_001174, partial [Bacillariaceae sp.]